VRNPEWRGRKRVHGVIPDVGTIKYENIYIRCYSSVPELERGLKEYFAFYNEERLHQSLGYETPGAIYRGSRATRA
jgi:putative transposase